MLASDNCKGHSYRVWTLRGQGPPHFQFMEMLPLAINSHNLCSTEIQAFIPTAHSQRIQTVTSTGWCREICNLIQIMALSSPKQIRIFWRMNPWKGIFSAFGMKNALIVIGGFSPHWDTEGNSTSWSQSITSDKKVLSMVWIFDILSTIAI